jgi:hypothetical protein
LAGKKLLAQRGERLAHSAKEQSKMPAGKKPCEVKEGMAIATKSH